AIPSTPNQAKLTLDTGSDLPLHCGMGNGIEKEMDQLTLHYPITLWFNQGAPTPREVKKLGLGLSFWFGTKVQFGGGVFWSLQAP
ncbi:hypothetical protein DSO57_1038843, partial [Entomophthora muscae]